MVLPASDGISRVPPYSGSTPRGNQVSTTGLLPSSTDLSRSLHLLRSFVTPYRVSYNPKRQALLVWANSVSLAATQEIAFAFSSSGYLDVSVPRVCLSISYVFRIKILFHYEQWVSSFGNLRIKAHFTAPEAYRC